MNKINSKVFIIDDDEEIRSGISLLLKSAGYNAVCYNSAEQFLKIEDNNSMGCILLDVMLEGKSGLELQEEIEMKFDCLPIIFLTANGNIPMSVEAIKKGAINFLQKPVDENKLIKAIVEALNKSKAIVSKYNELDKLKSLINSLTAREYEIYRCLITGMLNKQIASELGIAEHTVKNHRLNITDKLGVKSVAEMVYMAEKLSIKGATINNP
jgi:FixJ family two-component response regulator